MGKSLIIRGANFSNNGIAINPAIGTLVYVNSQDNAMNFDLKQNQLSPLSPSGDKIKVIVYSDDSYVNTQLQGATINFLSSAGWQSLGTTTLGSPLELDYPLAATIVVQTSSDFSGLSGKKFKVAVFNV